MARRIATVLTAGQPPIFDLPPCHHHGRQGEELLEIFRIPLEYPQFIDDEVPQVPNVLVFLGHGHIPYAFDLGANGFQDVFLDFLDTSGHKGSVLLGRHVVENVSQLHDQKSPFGW
jgi:hypothetical protein